MLVFGGLSLVFFPIVAPSQTGFIACVFIFGVCVGGLGQTPIIQDYVEKESYGRAYAFAEMGLSIGVVLSLSVLFEFTKDLDP